ncbi:3-deoxy-manno-octulosonate cytidylyltransferase [Neorhizobium sp. NCHU2750]|uniref:3-deoxy-manno-octulosonate cytidylyltransferase n=1 Tax=Neorhizobium sp. NCHU2750 TaxID=1825976 RepID=UPI001FDF421E
MLVPPSVSGLREQSEWSDFFSRYSHIVLVANSDQIRIDDLQSTYPDTALFVFFNKVYKVLDKPFSGRALLISRGQPKGANIVYRNEVAEVLRLFSQDNFLGVLNMRLSETERLNESSDYLDAPTGHLDLVGYCNEFYPEGKLPTSGFAIALWLAEQKIQPQIILAGFTGQRSDKWRVVSAHDWTFEQVFLKLLARQGNIVFHGSMAKNSYETLLQRFPEFPVSAISSTIADVLSARQNATEAQVDKLISLTNVLRSFDNFLRGLRPGFLRKKKK